MPELLELLELVVLLVGATAPVAEAAAGGLRVGKSTEICSELLLRKGCGNVVGTALDTGGTDDTYVLPRSPALLLPLPLRPRILSTQPVPSLALTLTLRMCGGLDGEVNEPNALEASHLPLEETVIAIRDLFSASLD